VFPENILHSIQLLNNHDYLQEKLLQAKSRAEMLVRLIEFLHCLQLVWFQLEIQMIKITPVKLIGKSAMSFNCYFLIAFIAMKDRKIQFHFLSPNIFRTWISEK